MNIAIIFAGGWGQRMHEKSKPKQFLEHRGKPIIIYTLEIFDKHPQIDSIVIACLEQWIPHLKRMIKQFEIKKISSIVPGGETGQDSIYNGLSAAKLLPLDGNDIVLIHDGVRPFITGKTITDNIINVKESGSCITCSPATETFLVNHEFGALEIPARKDSLLARAPQSFFLKDILAVHEKARRECDHDFIDSCTMMHYYGYNKLTKVIGPTDNIKITTPLDFFMFKAIVDVKENWQILGLENE